MFATLAETNVHNRCSQFENLGDFDDAIFCPFSLSAAVRVVTA